MKTPLLVVEKGPEKSLHVVEKLTEKALPLCERELHEKSLPECVELVIVLVVVLVVVLVIVLVIKLVSESHATVYPL